LEITLCNFLPLNPETQFALQGGGDILCYKKEGENILLKSRSGKFRVTSTGNGKKNITGKEEGRIRDLTSWCTQGEEKEKGKISKIG